MDLNPLFKMYPWVLMLATGCLGLVVGSFLNVVIHRLPRMMEREWRRGCVEDLGCQCPPDQEAIPDRYNLVVPRSACPNCSRPIKAWENIPVLSYLCLRGRCAGCRTRISVRYPLVELLTGVLSAWVGWRFGWGVALAGALILTWALVALAFIDLDTQLLPDDITLPLLWLGLLINVPGVFVPLPQAVIGAAAGYLILWSVYWLFLLIRGKEGMGYGDFKLLAALGAWFGWPALPAIILLSSLSGAVIGIASYGFDRRIPFGPYLAAGGWITLVYGSTIRQWVGI